ncbi:MAG TPA: hypothetical protein VME21_04860 [Steroidobacteraceae bacterium]|nr:hypothetical protein [Steroidobacteraceae bacterium]
MKPFSRRTLHELGALQGILRELSRDRTVALRMLLASRCAATRSAQHEFWLEYTWIDQEYRAAVRRLVQFCVLHGGPPGGSPARR